MFIQEQANIRDAEDAWIAQNDQSAGYLPLKEPTRAMKTTPGEAGTWNDKGEVYDCIQMLTVKVVVEDKRLFRTPARLKDIDDHMHETSRF